ncbi:MAG: hypothetical protein NC311_06390 [Muribaculaceae bacterium]|nr:hypothetical protein [Muribaculaceae bacterium]
MDLTLNMLVVILILFLGYYISEKWANHKHKKTQPKKDLPGEQSIPTKGWDYWAKRNLREEPITEEEFQSYKIDDYVTLTRVMIPIKRNVVRAFGRWDRATVGLASDIDNRVITMEEFLTVMANEHFAFGCHIPDW